MKISKTGWLVLAAGIMVVAFGSLGAARVQQVEEQRRLDEQLTLAESRLEITQVKELRTRESELQTQLDKTKEQLEEAKDDLRQPIESIDVTDFLFGVAGASGVEILDVSSSELDTEKLEKVNCSVVRLTVRVQGDLPNIIDFVSRLNDDFATGLVKSAQISISGEEVSDNQTSPEQSDNQTAPGQSMPSASVRLFVYSYRGG